MSKISTHWLKLALFAVVSLTSLVAKAQILPADSQPGQMVERMDSVDISLITCEPHDMIYALYGHTGIRINDRVSGEDILANWGIFDQRQSFFALRFAFGITDYRMEIETWEGFKQRYDYFRCGIREQVLNLTAQEKQRIVQAIFTNYLPENRYYRYNFFYDNCTSRARDIIVENLDGKIEYGANPRVKTSFREEIHQWNENHKWARGGNDFLLGIGSDRETNRSQQQFLPDTLRVDFNRAVIINANQQRKLVKEERWATPSQHIEAEGSPWENFTEPWALGLYLAVLLIIISLMERFMLHRRIWLFDAFLLLLSGIPGLVLTAMIFSQHPTVSLNFQILVFNPLALIFGWNIIKGLRQGRLTKAAKMLAIMALLGYVSSHWQSFADGTEFLAMILLVRFISTSGLRTNEKK